MTSGLSLIAAFVPGAVIIIACLIYLWLKVEARLAALEARGRQ